MPCLVLHFYAKNFFCEILEKLRKNSGEKELYK